MISYKLSYFCAVFSLFAAIVSAMTHNLAFTLINTFFVIFNWEMAQYTRRKSNDTTRKSDTDDTEDKE